jgi:hypothetical protein
VLHLNSVSFSFLLAAMALFTYSNMYDANDRGILNSEFRTVDTGVIEKCVRNKGHLFTVDGVTKLGDVCAHDVFRSSPIVIRAVEGRIPDLPTDSSVAYDETVYPKFGREDVYLHVFG